MGERTEGVSEDEGGNSERWEKWKWAAENEVMATQGMSGISKGSRLPRTRRQVKEGQKKLDWKEEEINNRTREKGKKKVMFEESDKKLEVMDERKKLESIRKEMREGIEKGLYEIKKEMKKILEGLEENKKKDRNAEVRVRLLKEKVDKLDTDIKKIKKGMKKLESKVKDNFVEDSEERMSVRSLAK